MTTINAAGGLSSRAYTAKETSMSFPIEAPERIIVGLASSQRETVSGELKQRLLDASTFEALTMLPAREADNMPAKIWGNIEVGGKVVAQIYNSGGVAFNSDYQLPAEYWGSDDPAVRARGMIEAYGGTLVMRSQMQNPELFQG